MRLVKDCNSLASSVVPREVWVVQTPLEIPKISVESSIA